MTNIFLDIIKWDQNYDTLLVDCSRAFSLLVRKGVNDSDMMDAWYIVSKKAPFISFLLFRKFKDLNQIHDEKAVTDIIISSCKKSFEDPNKISDIILISSLMDGFPNIVRNVYIDEKEICEDILSKLELMSYNSMDYLHVIKMLYGHADEAVLISAMYMYTYTFNKKEVFEELKGFLCQLIYDGNFRFAYIIIKIYDVNIEELELDVAIVYQRLKQSDKNNFFRAALMYKELISAEKNLTSLVSWYSQINSVENEYLISEKEGIKLLFICYALQSEPTKAASILIKYSNFIEKIQPIEYKKQHIREYRRAVYTLIVNDKIHECYNFLVKTSFCNKDRYEVNQQTGFPAVNTIRKHLIENKDSLENNLLEHLFHEDTEAYVLAYVYFNSFLRGLYPYEYFVQKVVDYYGIEGEFAVKYFPLCGTVIYDDARDIYYFSPANVKKGKGKFVLEHESRKLLQLFDSSLDNNWVEVSFYSFNRDNNFFKFAVHGANENRMMSLTKLIWDYEKNGLVTKELMGSLMNAKISRWNGNFIGENVDNTNLIEMSIAVLAAITSNFDKVRETTEIFEKINFFASKVYRNSGYERKIKGVTREHYRRVYKYWDKLSDSQLSLEDKFFVYQNTILRRCFGLSDFLEKQSKGSNDDYATFFSNVGKMRGKIQIVSKSREKEDSIAIAFAPLEFNMTNRNRLNTERKYDQYWMTYYLYGESASSVRKKRNLFSKQLVWFSIERYDGVGKFIVSEFETISIPALNDFESDILNEE